MVNSAKPKNNQDWFDFILNGELTEDFLRYNPLNEKEYNSILRIAGINNMNEIIEFMLDYNSKNYQFINDRAFQKYCKTPFVQAINFYLNDYYTNPAADNNLAIINACSAGQFYKIELLLEDERINPADQDNLGFIYICFHSTNESLALIKRFLNDPRFNPATQNNRALVEAFAYDSPNIAYELSQDSRVNPIQSNNVIIDCLERAIALCLEEEDEDQANVLKDILTFQKTKSRIQYF